jgi:hypothetical protein
MLLSELKLVAQVIDRITRMQRRDPDALDTVEMIMKLQEEFGAEPVRWAYRFLVARGVAQSSLSTTGEREPMWDRDLDG